MKKIIISLLALSILGYGFILGFLYVKQDKLVFVTDDADISKCPNIEATGARYQEVKLNSGLGRYISYNSPDSKSAFFVFHGNAGSICDRLKFLNQLKRYPTDIYLIEYPGYARSDAKLSDELIWENTTELVQALAPNYQDKQLVIFGESLGTGVATYVAKQITETKALVIQSPYTSISDVAQFQYPFIPVKMLLNHHFELKEIAPKVKADVFLFYGKQDKVVPPEISETQSKRFNTLKFIKGFEDVGHYNIRKKEEFWNQLDTILN